VSELVFGDLGCKGASGLRTWTDLLLDSKTNNLQVLIFGLFRKLPNDSKTRFRLAMFWSWPLWCCPQ